MGTQEFYIRAPAETESHGPYTLEQLVSLAEAGRIDSQTLYYDGSSETWMVIVHNPHLKALLFPEKKRLSLRPKDTVAPLEPESANPGDRISVEEMLAAADGRTADTKSKRDRKVDFERAATIGRLGIIGILLISMAALTLPSADVITAFDLQGMLSQPQCLLGLFDLGLALLLLLGMTEIYPLIRFRAAIGLGFFGVMGWLQGHNDQLFMVIAGYVGLFFSTLFLTYVPLIISLLVGILGMGAYAYFTLVS